VWAALPYSTFGLVGRSPSAATGFVFLVFSALLFALGLLGYFSGVLRPASFAVPEYCW